MSTFFLILALIVSLACLGVFSGAETALFSLSSSQLRSFKNDPDVRKKKIAKLLSQPRELLITLLILIIVSSILVQNLISSLVGNKASWGISVGIPLALNLMLGEVIPKSLALVNNIKVSYKIAPFLFSLQKLMFPLREILSYSTNFIIRTFFFFLKKEEDISLPELQHALKKSSEHGVIHSDEAELIRGYLQLEKSNVKELMRPREEVIYYNLEDPVSKLIHLFVDQECSRILVCRKGLDTLEGIISSRLFFLYKSTIYNSKDLIPILKKPFFVPELMTAESLLEQMYERKESLAVVVDEHGSVSGIIAFEDLVEVVVGEITDRRDSKTLYTQSKGDVIIASGKLELTEFEEIFQHSLFSPNNMVTIGGWLTEQLGDIPKTGTKYVTDDFLFHVLSADATRVRRVYIRKFSAKKSKGAK
ncbi:MAG: HlyC/CorC family transporter [Chlamydiae bacterium]|nr:HlyC/CorC family transporter [Chlamydiota bacterium]